MASDKTSAETPVSPATPETPSTLPGVPGGVTDEAGVVAASWTPPAAPSGLSSSPPLPSRMERRQQQRRQRRRRRIRFLLVAVLAVAVVAGGVLLVTREESSSQRNPPVVTPVSKMSTVLFAYQGANREAELLIVFGVPQKGSEGSALLVPPSTQVEIPSFGSGPVGSALRRGGPKLLQMSLANALGIEVGPVVVLDDAQLTSIFEPVEPLDANLPNTQDDEGDNKVLTTDEVVGLLTSSKDDATELDHQVVAHGIFAAWLQALRLPVTFEQVSVLLPDPTGDGVDKDATASRAGVVQLLQALAVSEVRFDTVPVSDIGALGNEAYQLQRDLLLQTMSRDFPGALLSDGVRPRVEILNGTGGIGVAQAVTARLLPGGVEVVITGNADRFDYAQTVVFYDDAKDRAIAERIVAVLGVGKLQRRRPVASASVSVIVGTDFKTEQ